MSNHKFSVGKLGVVDPIDQKWIVNDPNYDVAKNKAIIEKTISDYEAMRAKKAKEHDKDYEERADAMVSYLRSLDQRSSSGIGSSSNMEKYFGRRMLAYLRGEEIRAKLMAGMGVVTPDGRLLKKAST